MRYLVLLLVRIDVTILQIFKFSFENSSVIFLQVRAWTSCDTPFECTAVRFISPVRSLNNAVIQGNI